MKHKNKGFTLIEMAIVLLIIGVLVGIMLRNIGGQTALSRDTRRSFDLRNTTVYLSSYFARFGRYPTSTTWTDLENVLKGAGITDKLPRDPSGGDYKYFYCSSVSGAPPTHAVLGAQFELSISEAPRLWDNAITSTSWTCNVNISTECDIAAKKYCIAI